MCRNSNSCFAICEEIYFININYHISTPESRETKVLSNFEDSESRHKEVTRAMLGYQGENVCISCLKMISSKWTEVTRPKRR